MSNTLDQPISTFRAQLYQAADIVAKLYHDVENQKVYNNPDPQKTMSLFDESLPQEAEKIDELITRIDKEVIANSSKHYSPHFYPWVTSCASQASIVGDFLATALNVNATTWMNSAAASEIEKQVIKWMGQFTGYDSNASGVLLSGGSTANLTGLAMARYFKSNSNIAESGLSGQKQMTVYISDQSHFCFDKAVDLLGLGKTHLRKIPSLPDYTMDVHLLENQIKHDIEDGLIPISIVGCAGTVNTGAIDPLYQLARLCDQYDMWFHIDGAYGGCAANLPMTRSHFKGFEKADSVAIDMHKWFFVPFEAGCILVKDKHHLKNTFSVVPEYQKFDHDENLQIDFSEYSFQQSRNFKALKIWMNFKSYGSNALKSAITHSIEVMKYLSMQIEKSRDFELIATGLSIVCFRFIGGQDSASLSEMNDLNLKIVKASEADQRIFIRETKLGEMVVLRVCCTNFRRTTHHVDYLLELLTELGSVEQH